MYQQERGKNDVNKTESRNTIFPKYFSSNLLFHAPPFQESNRIERLLYPSVGGYKSSINHRFSFFFFQSFRLEQARFHRYDLSLFFPPRRSMAERGGKSGGHVLEFPPLPLPIISLTRRGRHVSTHVPCVGARA